MRVTFYGVRGSFPCPGGEYARYGGNTACVSVEVDGEPPLLLDMGTGLIPFGRGQPLDGRFRATALVTHTHWDHIQGLPYFAPVNRVGAELDVFGPPEEGMSLTEIFDGAISPPMFPVSWRALAGRIRFHDVVPGTFSVGSFRVTAGEVPHPGAMLGYRVQAAEACVAYVSDDQMSPLGGPVDRAVLELCRDVDLLIHDAQYTDAEFADKADWGHCTIGYALRVAREAGARRLALFHHDPAHDDEMLDALVGEALSTPFSDVEVFAAREGMVVALGPDG